MKRKPSTSRRCSALIPANDIVAAARLLRLPPAKLLAVYALTRYTQNTDPTQADATFPHVDQARLDTIDQLIDAMLDSWCQGEVRI